jgi:hypothetical protein
VYWDLEDVALRSAMVNNGRTEALLKIRLSAARRRLQAAGKDKLAQFYKETQINAMRDAALSSNPGKAVFESLLTVERELVTQARAAALKMAAFSAHRDAAQARRDLAEFGMKVTETFNARLGNVAVGGALRPLGALMFITAAQVLDPSLKAAASAMFNVIDVRDDVKFPPDGFPNHDSIAEADIVRSETLVHVAD